MRRKRRSRRCGEQSHGWITSPPGYNPHQEQNRTDEVQGQIRATPDHSWRWRLKPCSSSSFPSVRALPFTASNRHLPPCLLPKPEDLETHHQLWWARCIQWGRQVQHILELQLCPQVLSCCSDADGASIPLPRYALRAGKLQSRCGWDWVKSSQGM